MTMLKQVLCKRYTVPQGPYRGCTGSSGPSNPLKLGHCVHAVLALLAGGCQEGPELGRARHQASSLQGRHLPSWRRKIETFAIASKGKPPQPLPV
jgi:hypothetical protein